MKYDIFISYFNERSRGGSEPHAAAAVAYALQNEMSKLDPTPSVFFDETDIRAGDRWPRKIKNAVKGCKVFICVMTDYWNTSDGIKDFKKEVSWVRKELLLAKKERIPVLPVWCGSAGGALKEVAQYPKQVRDLLKSQLSQFGSIKYDSNILAREVSNILDVSLVNRDSPGKDTILAFSKLGRAEEMVTLESVLKTHQRIIPVYCCNEDGSDEFATRCNRVYHEFVGVNFGKDLPIWIDWDSFKYRTDDPLPWLQEKVRQTQINEAKQQSQPLVFYARAQNSKELHQKYSCWEEAWKTIISQLNTPNILVLLFVTKNFYYPKSPRSLVSNCDYMQRLAGNGLSKLERTESESFIRPHSLKISTKKNIKLNKATDSLFQFKWFPGTPKRRFNPVRDMLVPFLSDL